jgi:hypothetical protein
MLLDAWDAAVAEDPEITRTEFAKGVYERSLLLSQKDRQQSVRAVEKRLTGLLKAREPEQKLKAAVKRPSLLNEVTVTSGTE